MPEIHRALLERGVAVCERTVTNLLDRYDELVATPWPTTTGCGRSWPGRGG